MAFPVFAVGDPVAPLESLLNSISTAGDAGDAATLAAAGTAALANVPYRVANLAALDAVTTASVGSLAYMTTPGTGIDALLWEAYTGSGATIDWRPSKTVRATTLVNLTAFSTAAAAVSDLVLPTGTLGQVATEMFERRWNGTSWKPFGSGLLPIVPTSSTGGTIGTEGVVTFTAQSGVQINGCFTSDFDHYKIVVKYTTSVSATQSAQLGTAGTLYSSAQYATHIAQLDTTYATADVASQTSWSIQNVSATEVSGWIELFNPQDAVATHFGTHFNVPSSTTVLKTSLNSGRVNVTNQHTDFRIATSSGTITGTIRIYGYNDN